MRPFTLSVFLLFLGGLAWALSLSGPAVREVQNVYYSSISPWVNQGDQARSFARSFVQEVEHSKDLKIKLDRALAEKDRLSLIASRVRELEDSNNELRRALGFKRATPFNVSGAQVVRRKPLTWAPSIEINRGARDGLGVSQTVVASNGGLIGRVYQPGDHLSSVVLATYEGSMVSARVEGTSEVGIVQGQRSNFGKAPGLSLRFLSRTARVRRGMKVFTDGRGKLFPPNILIGTIEDFETGPVDGTASITPSVNFENLKTVFVITGNPDAEQL